MLEIRPCCEHYEKNLPNESIELMICTFECTYCKTCAEDVLKMSVRIVAVVFLKSINFLYLCEYIRKQ